MTLRNDIENNKSIAGVSTCLGAGSEKVACDIAGMRIL